MGLYGVRIAEFGAHLRGVFALKSVVPEVTPELGASASPINLWKTSEPAFYAFSASVLLVGPRGPFPASSQPGARWRYVKLIKAAVTYRSSARDLRAAFDRH